jgi:hypothetical protein
MNHTRLRPVIMVLGLKDGQQSAPDERADDDQDEENGEGPAQRASAN